MTTRHWFVLAAWLGVAAVFIVAAGNETVGMLVSLPVMVTAWCFGLRGALLAAVFALPFHVACVVLGGESASLLFDNPATMLGHVFTGAFALFLGWSRTLRDRLEQETARRIDSEKARLQAEMEAKMLRADRLATIGTMAAGVAHEVNNPLTYVLGNVELLRAQIAEAQAGRGPSAQGWAELAEQLAEIDDGAQRIQRIMSELKLFVREHDEQLQPVDLQAVAEVSTKLTRHELKAGTTLERHFCEVPTILGDAGKLAQVFVNLLVNAAQAIPAERDDGRIVFELSVTKREVIAKVSDNGIGMSDEARARAFEPFFTTKPVGVGTGLGLAMCASIVRQHRGEIELDSEPGRGTTFRLRFPTADCFS